MKTVLPLISCLAMQLFNITPVKAQQAEDTKLFRVFVDNDFLNSRGKGTDDAYTGGNRLDFFYTKHHHSRFFIDRIMPKAGDSSINVFGWSLMQVFFTPMNLTEKAFQPFDYPYSGSLFAIHSLYSYNARHKYSFQTGLLIGMMGPASLAEQTQTLFHQLIHYKAPEGWGNQLGNNPLLNINFTAEKQFTRNGKWITLSGGAQASAGTAWNSLSMYPLARIGKMNPYFNGYLAQFGDAKQHSRATRRGSRVQAYLILKPEAQLVLSNALLQGGIFSSNMHEVDGKEINEVPSNGLKRMVYSVNYGVEVSAGNFGMSFMQNSSSELLKNTYSHEYGNLSGYFSW